jgi:hypothetical protein
MPDAGLDIDFDALPAAPANGRKAPQNGKNGAGPGIEPATDRELAKIQGAAAKVVPGTAETVTPIANGKPAEMVEFQGRQFRIADKIGLMPLLKFSAFADVATNDPRALGAMYAMLRDCIHPGSPGCGECEDCKNGSERACEQFDAGDWPAFEDHAMATRADAEELFDVITKVMELIAGRPTKPSGSSSPGPRRTSGGSTGSSSSRRAKASRR